MANIVTFDYPNRRIIEVAAGDNALDVSEIYSEWKIDVQNGNSLGDQPAFSLGEDRDDHLAAVIGGQTTPTPAGALGTTYFLGPGWKIRPAEVNHRLILRGNIYTFDGTRITANTLGSFTVEVAIEFTNLIDNLAKLALRTQVSPLVGLF